MVSTLLAMKHKILINTLYSSFFYLAEAHFWKSNWHKLRFLRFNFALCLFNLFYIFDNDYAHEGWIKRKIFVTLNWMEISLSLHHHELKFARVGHIFTPRIGWYRSAKMGRENVIIQLKEDTQCQSAWDYEQENVRKMFNFNFAGGKRKIALIKFHCDHTSFL